jgi:hypothetical protein
MELRQLLKEVETRNAVLDVVAEKVESWREKLSVPMNDDQQKAIELDIQNVRRFVGNSFREELETASALFHEFGRMTGFLSQIVPDAIDG